MHVDTVLLKVASRCNLDCSYCYVYHMGDDGWRRLPKRMSVTTEAAVIKELGALLAEQKRPFSVVLHGGEPLLLGAKRLNGLLHQLRQMLDIRCSISIQTNGVLISDAILDVCNRHDVSLSVSIDGPELVHDRFRVDLRDRGTHAQVMQGIAKLKAHSQSHMLFSGVLAVVDPQSAPFEVYSFFKELGTPSVDFLYRDGNHSSLPFGKSSALSTEYGKWLGEILDLYVSDVAPFRIRILDDMLKLLLGGIAVKEGVGLTDYGILVIDTDGTIKKNDTLKSSPNRDSFTSDWNVGTVSLSTVASSEEFHRYHQAQRPTSSICNSCPFLRICGGGMLTHRFKADSGYDNPTVFCADQKYLIQRMQGYVERCQDTFENVA